jgi:hypothetical protein
VHAAERHDAREAPARANDHLAADLLAQDPVRRAHVVARLGCDRGALQPEPVPPNRRRGLVHDLVPGCTAVLERQVEARQVDRDPDHVRREDPNRLLEQLLAGLVALEDDDRLQLHRGQD